VRRKEKTVLMAILIGLLGLILGFFLGEFFVFLSNQFDILSFMSVFGYSLGFGPEGIDLNLLFVQLSFGIVLNISIMGVIVMIACLIIYFRRR